MVDFLRGVRYFFEGMALLFRPGIKRYVVIPLLINVVIFVLLFGVMQHYVEGLNDWLAQWLPSWLQWMSVFVWLLFLASFLLVVMVLFVLVANLISAPFNSLLSEKVEYLLTGAVLPSASMLSVLTDAPRVIGRQLAMLLYYSPRAIGCLILFFIPVIQVVAPWLWFYLNARFMVFTYYDYPSDNHRESFEVMRASIDRQKMLGLGFGVAVLGCAMIPLLNLLTIPAAVAGATKWWLVQHEERSVR